MIELKEFTKRYGRHVAVDSLSLQIPAGELFGFIGPNGAGKSTTIRFLATLLKATAGDGFVNGYSVRHQPLEVRRCIGYMPDNFGVYEGMRVWDFMEFFASAYQIPWTRRRRAIEEVLELLNLGEKRQEYVNNLSRGMKQRLSLAKALVHDPPVLILDEPTSGLDPRARIELKSLFRQLRRQGKTILLSSHVLTELADCCTSLGIIERGRLLMAGPVQEIARRISPHRIVHIQMLQPAEMALPILQQWPQMVQFRAEDHSLWVELDGNEATAAQLLQKLVQAGLQIYEFAQQEANIEEIFLRVTQGMVG
ncbi:MAG: ABC transporter ATP-binding protein [Thermoguttaceae bacterium]|nr:ABC transporter ATP-binding protein [Thermoguttaceae bacterium]MDW8037979.1 ABC transporter ATP-binding protein [Thermoguttaceae bacterium]